MTAKISSRNIVDRTVQKLQVATVQDEAENERRARQLLFMARQSHPEKVRADVVQELVGDTYFWSISLTESTSGMDYNPEIYGPTRYVEDLVD